MNIPIIIIIISIINEAPVFTSWDKVSRLG